MSLRLEIIRPGGRDPIHLTEFVSWTVTVSADPNQGSSFGAVIPPTLANRTALREAIGGMFRLWVDDGLQFTGLLDSRSDDTGIDATDLHIGGRDMSGLLRDCPVPANRLRIADKTLLQIAVDWTEPWRQMIPSVAVDSLIARYMASASAPHQATPSLLRQVEDFLVRTIGSVTMVVPPPKQPAAGRYRRSARVGRRNPAYAGIGTEQLTGSSVRLGTSIWAALMDLSMQVGAQPVMAPDGHLIITRPNYALDDTYGIGIVLGWDSGSARATYSNIMGIRFETSIEGRRSEWWISGAGKPKKTARGSEILRRHVVKDPGPAFWSPSGGRRLYKPGVLQTGRIGSSRMLVRYARRHVGQTIRDSLSWDVDLAGLAAETGVLWVPDTMVAVEDQRNGIHQPAYILSVTREQSLSAGTTTRLQLTLPDLVLGELDDPGKSDAEWEEAIRQRIWW